MWGQVLRLSTYFIMFYNFFICVTLYLFVLILTLNNLNKMARIIIGEGTWSSIRANINAMYQELMAATAPTTTAGPTTTAAATTTSAGAYSAEYQAVYNTFGTKPAADIATAQNAMVSSLVSGGYWARMDLFYVLATNSINNQRINWLNPATFLLEDPSAVLSFTAFEGSTGNGVNYFNTYYNPSTNKINLSLNSATIGIYIRNDQNADVYPIGLVVGSDQLSFEPSGGDRKFYTRINSSTSLNATITTGAGLWFSTRRSSTDVQCYQNGVSKGSGSVNSTAIPNENLYLFARSAGMVCSMQISLVFIMNGVTTADVVAITNILETYMDSNGKGIIP